MKLPKDLSDDPRDVELLPKADRDALIEALRKARSGIKAALAAAFDSHHEVAGGEVDLLGELVSPPESTRRGREMGRRWRFAIRSGDGPDLTPLESQGLCDTTLTERFRCDDCACGSYEGNLGPCRTFLEGALADACVYCDHAASCHGRVVVELSKLDLEGKKQNADQD